jgi:hypothetical protein
LETTCNYKYTWFVRNRKKGALLGQPKFTSSIVELNDGTLRGVGFIDDGGVEVGFIDDGGVEVSPLP